MSTTHDGGPAFPVPVIEYNGSHHPMSGDPLYMAHGGGMTLRDYFATAAMTGLLADPEDITGKPELTCAQSVAFYAYELADAMIERRGK